jgi:hypothetical protein
VNVTVDVDIKEGIALDKDWERTKRKTGYRKITSVWFGQKEDSLR